MQSLIITRAIFSILAIPVAILFGALFSLALTFYAFTVSPPLALIPLGIGVLGVIGLYRWERIRVERETPRDEE